MKNEEVCIGCKYHVIKGEFFVFNNTCDYCSETGRSRLKKEQEAGGYRKDSCVCYEEGEWKGRFVDPYGKERGGHDEG